MDVPTVNVRPWRNAYFKRLRSSCPLALLICIDGQREEHTLHKGRNALAWMNCKREGKEERKLTLECMQWRVC